jgi:phosphoglucomutase
MERDELVSLAEQYLAEEEHDFFRSELEALLKDENYSELEERFYRSLDFGTGGLRGIIGAGTNRMNPAMVRKATQGLANYINASFVHGSAVIAYDSRNFSDTFAEEAARVLAGNGIKVFLFSSLRPTPELSYAVRQLKASAGIVVTASHNPPEYNGYKVYWADGGQVVPPHDSGIISEVRKVNEVKKLDLEDAKSRGLIQIIDSVVDDPFVEMIKSNSLLPDLIKEKGTDVKVVYTPLHGTGTMLVERVLGEMGIEVVTVPEQREPDGNFPTVDFPNPEEASAMKMAIDLGKKVSADLVMGTDPDSDRFGIAVPKDGDYVLITGNQLGALIADYMFRTMKEQGKAVDRPVLVKTIVTTNLQKDIAHAYGAASYDVLTGFKYIAEKIKEFETTGETYVFGGEESYGFLVGSQVRDKDAIGAAAMTAEMALWNLSRGKTVLDHLNEIYEAYGYYEEMLLSKTFKGQKGVEQIQGLMKSLRAAPPKELAGIAVEHVRDYESSEVRELDGSVKEKIFLPSSNVLQFELTDGSLVTARPSGTEPKIKFYASAHEESGTALEEAKISVGAKIKGIKADLESIIQKAQG